jgi:hypothetical protein
MFIEFDVQLHNLPSDSVQDVQRRVTEALAKEFLPSYRSDIQVDVTCHTSDVICEHCNHETP